MPVDIGRKQTIEEITNGRIKKVAAEAPRPTRGREQAEERPMQGRKAGRSKR